MRKMIFLLGFLSVCFSCGSITKTVYGVKKPKLESKHSVNVYLNKKKIDTSRTYVFKNLLAFLTAAQKKFVSFPDAYFFNDKGFAVAYPKSSANCNAKVGDFIADMSSF